MEERLLLYPSKLDTPFALPSRTPVYSKGEGVWPIRQIRSVGINVCEICSVEIIDA